MARTPSNKQGGSNVLATFATSRVAKEIPFRVEGKAVKRGMAGRYESLGSLGPGVVGGIRRLVQMSEKLGENEVW